MREYFDRMPLFINYPIRRLMGWFRDKTFRRLLQNTGLLASANIIAAFMGLLSTVIKTRTLGAEQFGLLSVIIAYTMLVQQFSTFGSWWALIKLGADALKNEQPDDFVGQVKLSLLLDEIGAVSGTAIAIAGGYFFAMRLGWNLETSHMVAILSLSILFDLSGTPTGVLRLLDRFELLAVKNLSTSILSLTGALYVFLSGGGIWGFLIMALISSILGNLLLLVMAFIALRSRNLTQYWRVPIKNWKPFLRFSMWMYATSTVDIPVKRLDIIFVSAVISLEAAGIYKIIKQIVSLMDILVDPVYQAIYPQFATMIADHDSKGAARYSLKIGSVLLAVCGLMALGMAVTSSWWLASIFGEGFSSAVLPLNIFLFLRVISISTLAIHPLFNAMGYVKQNTLILLIANVMYLVLAWQLGYSIGLLGFAIAYGLQFSLIVGLKALHIARRGFAQNPVSS